MYEIFFVLGLTIFIGFIATIVFERTRVSQVILLMAFGLLLGPVLHIVDVSPTSIIVSILPFIASLALIILLFDAGLMIDVFAVARAIPKSTLFTVLVFFVTVLFVTAFTILFLQWNVLYGVLLGAVVGGTCSAIVVAMVEKAHVTKETRSLLTIESTITDALCIIVAVIIIQLILSKQTPEIATILNLLLSSFTIGILLGIVAMVLWMFIIRHHWVSKYAYMLTLALVFGLFAVTEALKGNGAFAVFVFGMILGNVKGLKKLFNLKNELSVSPMLRVFQEEITFFVRTFFFVYIGLLLSPDYFSLYVILVSVALLSFFIIARWIVQRIVLPALPLVDKDIVVIMLPRGLAAAVLATMPLSSGVDIPGFQQIVFSVILISNIAATLALFIFDKDDKGKTSNDKKEKGKMKKTSN